MFSRQQMEMVAHQGHQGRGLNNPIIFLSSRVRMLENRFPVTPALVYGVVFITEGGSMI
jgi:hypothetical protein